MAIIRPENMDFTKQTFSAIIYGSPGIGKTTLALSAPKPVLIDFDHGVSRVSALHRVPTIMCNTYEDVQKDVDSPDMKEFETIVIDTGGSFVTFLKDWATRTQKDAKTKTGAVNGLKVFGHVKSEFAAFTDKITKVMNKNVIYVFHSQEQTDKDGNTFQRLLCEGSVRNTVWNPCDFGGYLQMINNQRTLCLTPADDYFAKGTHGVIGRRIVPMLDGKIPNDFMTRLFEEARQNIIAEKAENEKLMAQYQDTMDLVRTCVDNVVDIETANMAVETIQNFDHALTSRTEALALLKTRTDSLGIKYSKAAGGYIPKDGGQ